MYRDVNKGIVLPCAYVLTLTQNQLFEYNSFSPISSKYWRLRSFYRCFQLLTQSSTSKYPLHSRLFPRLRHICYTHFSVFPEKKYIPVQKRAPYPAKWKVYLISRFRAVIIHVWKVYFPSRAAATHIRQVLQ